MSQSGVLYHTVSDDEGFYLCGILTTSQSYYRRSCNNIYGGYQMCDIPPLGNSIERAPVKMTHTGIDGNVKIAFDNCDIQGDDAI